MSIRGRMRPIDMRRDLDGLADLVEVAFAGELARRGEDFRHELQSAKRIVPLVLILGRISDDFRHVMDGFVWEDDKRIVASVTVQRMGSDKRHWLLGTVATHPDYRRRGLARALTTRALEHARTHGAEVCTLDVRSDNAAAYNLYRSMGFVHYDSTTDLKLETLPDVQAGSLGDYALRTYNLGEWEARYSLDLRAIPQPVQEFVPLDKASYRVSALQRTLIPLLVRLQRIDVFRWVVEQDQQTVGYMRLAARRVTRTTHEIGLTIDPDHRAQLGEPLLTLALGTLQRYPRQNTLISVRTAYHDLLALLDRYGFVEIETEHRLGLKLDASTK
jgi:ribosomal protein S18 acetylase RimI-like enzyme